MRPPPLDFPSLLRVFWSIGCRSIGGPPAQIQLLHEEFVQKRPLISEHQFQSALAFCTLIPGPEAHQLATYIGYLLLGIPGALCAGALFVLPGALCIAVLSALYVGAPQTPWLLGALHLLRPIALALLVAAAYKLARRIPRTPLPLLVGLASALLLATTPIPFPLLVLSAGLLGALLHNPLSAQVSSSAPFSFPRSVWRTLGIAALFLALWWVPILTCVRVLGREHPLAEFALLISRTSATSFGGAYATLPYVSSVAVRSHGWFSQNAMLDGLALGEATPGPLLLVFQFYGFLTGWNHPTPLLQPLAALLGSLIALWSTFIPSFFWILSGAPWTKTLLHHTRLNAGLRLIFCTLAGSLTQLSWHLLTMQLQDPAPTLTPWLFWSLFLACLWWRLRP